MGAGEMQAVLDGNGLLPGNGRPPSSGAPISTGRRRPPGQQACLPKLHPHSTRTPPALVTRCAGLSSAQLIARRHSDPEAARLLTDEGMVLVAQILMMGECGAMIGSYASNVAVLVHDLMFAERARHGEQLHALDVNGRSYCGCGASFCMTLERKALRDPTKSLKTIVDAFHS